MRRWHRWVLLLPLLLGWCRASAGLLLLLLLLLPLDTGTTATCACHV